MIDIRVNRVQAAQERLPEQIHILQELLEELKSVENRVSTQSYMEEACHAIHKAMQKTEEQIRILHAFRNTLNQVIETVQQAESNIEDVYNLEEIIYPATVFGVNEMAELEEYKELLTFQGLMEE